MSERQKVENIRRLLNPYYREHLRIYETRTMDELYDPLLAVKSEKEASQNYHPPIESGWNPMAPAVFVAPQEVKQERNYGRRVPYPPIETPRGGKAPPANVPNPVPPPAAPKPAAATPPTAPAPA